MKAFHLISAVTLSEHRCQLFPNWLIMRRLPKRYGNSVLLTFDDGPCELNTPKVLEVLKKYEAKAMFFVVGHRIEQAPHILKMITDEGHLLCNHSYSHNASKFMWPLATFRDLKKCNELIEKYGFQKSCFYRPPCGKIGLFNLLSAMILNQKILYWSVEGQDWNAQSEDNAVNIAKNMSYKISENDVVLLHDDHEHICAILKILLSRFKTVNPNTLR